MATTHHFWRDEVILSLTVTVFVHGTEDENKVLEAFRVIVPENVRVDRQRLKGYFGNNIVVLKARTRAAKAMRQIIDAIRCKLSRQDLLQLREQATQTLSEQSIVLFKFDKQAAVSNVLKLGKKDPIVVRARIAAHRNNARIC